MVERTEKRKELEPRKELRTPDNYRWFYYDKKQLGMPLICLEDLSTGVVVSSILPDPEGRTAAYKAFTGAKHSRMPGTHWEIMQEIKEKGTDPDARLEAIFTGPQGHASIGDLARTQLDLGNIPIHACTALFLATPLHGGQEKSTRYQSDFAQVLPNEVKQYLPEDLPKEEIEVIQKVYQEFFKDALDSFERQREQVAKAYLDYYQPADEKQIKSLNSRVLDTVRFFALWGQKTGMTYETSFRDWSRIISQFKDSPVPYYRRLAEHIQRFLTPSEEEETVMKFKAEAPRLIRHADTDHTVNNNLADLKKFFEKNRNLLKNLPANIPQRGYEDFGVEMISSKFSPADKMVTQYILTLYPGLDWHNVLVRVHEFEKEVKEKISQIIFNGQNNYQEMPYMAATTGTSVVVKTSLGEARDLLRHRAWSRFMPIPQIFGTDIEERTMSRIIARGYGLPLYLTEIAEFKPLKKSFEADFERYYSKLITFFNLISRKYGTAINYSFMLNLLPLAHRVDLFMDGNPKQAVYLPSQRVRPGGHINYRVLAWRMNQLISGSDPYLSGMRMDKRPDPADKDEFFERA